MSESEEDILLTRENEGYVENIDGRIMLYDYYKFSQIRLSQGILSYEKLNIYPHNIKQLSLLHSEIIEIEDNTFDELKNLNELIINFDTLDKINSKTFKKLNKSNNFCLTIIYTPYNGFEEDDMYMFMNNVNLIDIHNLKLSIESLFLNNNDPLPSNIFSNFIKLQKINLSQSYLNELPSDIFNNNINLLDIDISLNNIKEIPEDIFYNNTKLLKLDISGNNIEHLSPYIFKYNTELKNLNISFNKITQLNENIFYNNVKLSKLSLNSNRISHLDNNIFKNTINIKILDLSDNCLKDLDTNIFNSCKECLEILWLKQNKLTTIPNCISYLTNIKKLYINNNNINKLGISFKNNIHLEVLDLGYNKLEEIEPIMFHELCNLVSLHINHNKLNKIPSMIDNCEHLKLLYLNNNNITILPPVLKHIYLLDISKNPLKMINNVVFKNLRKIDITYTDIKRLTFNTKYNLHNIKKICINKINSDNNYKSKLTYIDPVLNDYIVEYKY